MILIADSGSTKTDWCVAENGKQVQRMTTKGINPYFQPEEDIVKELQTALLPQLQPATFDVLYFYGTGCLPGKIPMMKQALGSQIHAATIEVYSDMVGAARGLAGRNPGIVCILGTGSNSCYYDGKEIVSNVSPLGFILGDEGSGAVLGKLLVGDLLKNQLPTDLKEKFLQQFNLTPGDIIERVYRQPFPNRFLASLSPFLNQNIDVPEVRNLVLNAFKAFLTRNVKQYDYKNNKVHFIGSIAYHYKDILEEALQDTGMQLGTIAQAPMSGLVEYHNQVQDY
ncbi:MAG: ATPase [Candidatus Symbiothrix sp.]|jgi:N-acetylglucosamine kinase-like BadF-type ATPase|nr:ATPase [Candidatus Symbiothrix sp.]